MTGANLALLRDTTATGSTVSIAASCAIDGDTSGNPNDYSISSTTNSSPSCWQVALGGTYTIGQIVLWNRTDSQSSNLTNFTVSIFRADGSTAWSQSYYTSSGYVPSTGLSIALPAGTQGSTVEVRLNICSIRRKYNLSLAEVQVLSA